MVQGGRCDRTEKASGAVDKIGKPYGSSAGVSVMMEGFRHWKFGGRNRGGKKKGVKPSRKTKRFGIERELTLNVIKTNIIKSF